MQLKGNFDPSFLSSILQLLCNEKRTGVLRLRHEDDTEVKIFIYDGYIIYATSSRRKSQLGALLKNMGIISAEQLNQCLSLAQKAKQALGKILVEHKIISPAELKKVIRKQAEDIILSAFLWGKGIFEYNDAKLILKDMVVTNLDIISIILEATRRIDEMSVLTKCIPSDKTIFRLTVKESNPAADKFNIEEWKLLSLINGQRTVSELIAASGLDSFQVYKALNTLLSSGLIESCPNNYQAHSKRYLALIEPMSNTLRWLHGELLKEVSQWTYTVILSNSASHSDQMPIEKRRQVRERQINLWVQSLFINSKPEFENPQHDFLNFYSLERQEKENIQDVLKVLKGVADPDKGCSILAEGFGQFFENIFTRLFKFSDLQSALRLCAKVIQRMAPENDTAQDKSLPDMLSVRLQSLVQAYSNENNDPPANKPPAHPILGISPFSDMQDL
jgi:hypothetical protein